MKIMKYSKEILEKSKEFSDECIGCNLCVKECTMLKKYNVQPKQYFASIGEGENTDAVVPYSCNLCESCTEVCPKKLKPQEIFMDMRKEHITSNKGKSPMKGHAAIEMHQALSFSKLFNIVVEDKDAEETKRVFMPGCSLSSYKPELISKTYELLKNRLPGTGLVLKCCGKPTLDLGQKDKFEERYLELEKAIESTGAEEVITACQNCYKTLQKFSPGLKVKSLWNVLSEIGLDEEFKGKGKESDLVFSIHDACPTRYDSVLQDGVRAVVAELGYEVKETKRNRDKTRCCGFGGMVFPANPELGTEVMETASKEASEDFCITYCASCREAMARGGKKSVHILDLIFNDTYNSNSDFSPPPKSSIENWIKRYKSKAYFNNRR
jgi:Fe-S oxidoreductase